MSEVTVEEGMAVQEQTVQQALTGFHREVEDSRKLESAVNQARQDIVEHGDPNVLLAQMAADIAAQIRSSLEQNVTVLDELVRQNHLLRKKIHLLLQGRQDVTDVDEADEPEDDDRWFGTHIKEALSILRGR